ncbi:hypothetical protein [Prosthecobacter fluviatilis]|uniref:Uncharacterized protein n=1 Tax=Prosthecobacter fluviatilis TaxID=445931 RepID=A0ABW0KLW1_9BACT
MSSLLWLLLYLAPLLGLTAALFAWLGWHWRGTDMQKRIDALATQVSTAEAALREAESAHAAVLEKAATVQPPPPQDGRAAAELQALRADLKCARDEAHLRQEEAAKAHEATLALEKEMHRLLAELEQLRAAHASVQAELSLLQSTPAAAEQPEAAPAKPKRKRSTTAKAQHPAVTLHEKIASLESQLLAQQSDLAALTQERDGWQQRISQLEAGPQSDPAGLGLARRSLADTQKRLAAATAKLGQLQNQTRVLQHVQETSTALADVSDDDLTQIKGIKKIISDQLRAHGIRTWRQIALWDENERRAFSELLAFKNRATREQWQEQARALHEAAHGPLP